MRIFENAELQLHPLALARHRPVDAGHRWPASAIDGRAAACRSASTSPAAPRRRRSSSSRSTEDAVRAARSTQLPGERWCSSYGAAADNQVLIRLPLACSDEQRRQPRATARQRRRRRCRPRACPSSRSVSSELVGPVDRRAICSCKGIYATLASIVGIAVYIAHPLPLGVRDRRHRGHAARRAGHAGLPGASSATTCRSTSSPRC